MAINENGRSFELEWTIMGRSGRYFQFRRIVHFPLKSPSSFDPLDRAVLVQKTVWLKPTGLSVFQLRDRPLSDNYTVHFWTSLTQKSSNGGFRRSTGQRSADTDKSSDMSSWTKDFWALRTRFGHGQTQFCDFGLGQG